MQNLEKGFTKKKSHYIFVKHGKFDAEKFAFFMLHMNGVLWNLIEKNASCRKSAHKEYIFINYTKSSH